MKHDPDPSVHETRQSCSREDEIDQNRVSNYYVCFFQTEKFFLMFLHCHLYVLIMKDVFKNRDIIVKVIK